MKGSELNRNYQKSGARIGTVMVVGGGIAGQQAALDLADSGTYVYLVEKSPFLGGKVAQLDKTFPTDDCSLCIRVPKHIECMRHPNIEILTLSEVKDIQGEARNFQVTVLKHPRYVSEERCIECGLCEKECPQEVTNGLHEGLKKRKAIYKDSPQAVPAAYLIDSQNCIYFTKGECDICQKACEQQAIDLNQQEETIVLNVGAIILALGFDCNLPDMYQYANFPNVVTSMEFERMVNFSGPYGGHLVRPSDETEPKRIAWLQCIGSRDRKHGYCSAVCCMYAIKQAVLAKRHHKTLDVSIFYMDMRTHGKDYERYYDRARDDVGVRFIRSRAHTVYPAEASDNLIIRYTTEDGKTLEEEFDMAVLSTGLRPPQHAIELANRIGIELDKYNFVETSSFSPVATSRPGIYVCGAFQSPKDIPQTVVEASAAACASSLYLAGEREFLDKERVYPPERDVSFEEPRIGIFVCSCGTHIGGVINVNEICDYAKTLPYVAYVEHHLFACSLAGQEKIKQTIRERNLNRLVVAGCSPRTHQALFQEILRQAGLNKYLLEMANIRDQDSWIHGDRPEEATQKAKDLVRMAAARTALMEPLQEITVKPIPSALVIGGGVAGMVSSLSLADQGYNVHLLEKGTRLGGHALKLKKTWKGEDVTSYVATLVNRILEHEFIDVYLNSEVKDTKGYVGNFATTIATVNSKGEISKKRINHGVVIIATGAHSLKPNEYLYGKNPYVLRWFQLDKKIAKEPDSLKKVKTFVFIQCVGSREPERSYCSRMCCTHALVNALELKKLNPNMEIYILYRDMRTYGLREDLYTEARQKGIVFIRYDLDNKPQVEEEAEAKLKVTVTDKLLNECIAIYPDFITLHSAIVPRGHEYLARLFHVRLDEDNFFLETHKRLKPVDLSTDGVFVCGLAHYPKPIDESIAEAQAVAARATAMLSQDLIAAGDVVATVNEELCAACLTCVRVCPYGIPFINERGKAYIEAVRCQGCGICAAECPAKAITFRHFSDEQIIAECEALLPKSAG